MCIVITPIAPCQIALLTTQPTFAMCRAGISALATQMNFHVTQPGGSAQLALTFYPLLMLCMSAAQSMPIVDVDSQLQHLAQQLQDQQEPLQKRQHDRQPEEQQNEQQQPPPLPSTAGRARAAGAGVPKAGPTLASHSSPGTERRSAALDGRPQRERKKSKRLEDYSDLHGEEEGGGWALAKRR